MTVGEKIENIVGKNGIRLSNTDCIVIAFTREEWFKKWNQEKFMQEAPSCPMCEKPLGHDYEKIKKHEKQDTTTKNDLEADSVSRAEVRKIAKEMFLEVANMKLDVNTISDCISYTASKCREVLERKLQALSPVAPQEPRWIPVSERLPKEMFGCLVTVWDANPKTGEEFENILPEFVGYDGETWNGADGKPIAFEVIAWMPLPQSYKEDMSEVF